MEKLAGGYRMELGKNIAFYRKNKNMTQDALARALGISNQAVSKWETEQSCPDMELLPKIADIFMVTLDELFERSGVAQKESKNLTVESLPWEDDEQLRAVLFIGRKMVQTSEFRENSNHVCKSITFNYEGPARNIESYFNVSCRAVAGNVKADASVECGAVAGCVTAGTHVNCGDVGQSITAGAHVNCGEVGEGIVAGAHVNCGNVGAGIIAGANVECGNVIGDVSAGRDINCGNIQGDVQKCRDIECDNVGGTVYINNI